MFEKLLYNYKLVVFETLKWESINNTKNTIAFFAHFSVSVICILEDSVHLKKTEFVLKYNGSYS